MRFLVKLEGFRLRHILAFVLQILHGKLVHFLFDFYEVVGSERFFAQKFVEEAVIDRRANTELHVGVKLHHGSGKEVCGRMTEDKKRVGMFVREDF